MYLAFMAYFCRWNERSLNMAKREDVLQATLILVSEIGLEKTSTSLISKRAEVGMGTIYHYFESKEKLFSSLFDSLADKLKVLLMSSFNTETKSYQNFENVIKNLLCYYEKNINEFKFLEVYSDSAYDIPNRLDDILLLLDPILKFLDRESDTDIKFKSLPVEVTFAMVYGPLIAIVNLVHMNKLVLTEPLIKTIAKSCWDSIIEC